VRVAEIASGDIPANWEWMRALLAPAIALGNRSEDDVREMLEIGQFHALRVSDGGDGVIVYEIADGPRGRTMFITYIAGTLDGGPKERLGKMRQMESAFATVAKAVGCVEMKGGGRNWHRVLSGWEPDGGPDISIRKAV